MGEIGKIVEKRDHVEWTIDQFTLQLQEGFALWHSPRFCFSNVWWNLRLLWWNFGILSHGKATDGSTGWMSLYLVKHKCISDIPVCFTLGLKARDGTLYKSQTTIRSFGASRNYYGWSELVEMEEFIREKDKLWPDNVVTISCEVHLVGQDGINAQSRISSESGESIKQEDTGMQVNYYKVNRNDENYHPNGESIKHEDKGIQVDYYKENRNDENYHPNEKSVEQEDKAVQVDYNKENESDICHPSDIQENNQELVEQGEANNGIQEIDQEIHQQDEVSDDLDVLTTTLVGFFLNKKSCDITILIGDHCFEAHRLILGIRSPVFAAKFKNTMEQKNIDYHVDCDPDAFYKFLLYLYSSKIEDISIDLVVKLFRIAMEYEVSPLIKTCATYMINNISVDGFCDIFLVAQTHGEVELLQALKDFFVTNMKSIIITKTWKSFLNKHANLVNDLLMHVSKRI